MLVYVNSKETLNIMKCYAIHTACIAAVLEFDWSPVVWFGMYGSYGAEDDIFFGINNSWFVNSMEV